MNTEIDLMAPRYKMIADYSNRPITDLFLYFSICYPVRPAQKKKPLLKNTLMGI